MKKRKKAAKKPAKKKRRETPATRRLKRENAALKTDVGLLTLRLKKEQTKNDCYHDQKHRHAINRVVGPRVFVVTRCGYCGRELAAEQMSELDARRWIEDREAAAQEAGADLIERRKRLRGDLSHLGF